MKKIVNTKLAEFSFTVFLQKYGTALLIAVLLLISGVAHAYNMFHFPYYDNDEGTYMSQAWSLLTQGQIEPYTYWYDHAPGGWMFIALWTVISGGFFTFGVSVNSGRVFMLILHLLSTFFLFKITKKISGKNLAATVAVLFFALSPLAIYFQRRVLLDNIMVFWTLLSLFLLTSTPSKLRYIALSALTFGIAVLSKENAIFFAPTFLYAIFTKSKSHHRVFAIVEWLTINGVIISLYFIYALLRNEFFPVGFMGNFTPHVSLLTTLQEQASRGSNLPFWNPRSDFYSAWQSWLLKDSLFVITGTIASALTILLSIWKKSFRLPALLIGFLWIFFLRGKLVIDFYVIPLFPLWGMCIGLITEWGIEKLTQKAKYLYMPIALLFIAGIGIYYSIYQIGQFTHDETTPEINTINWIKTNIPADSTIIIDDYMYVDLHAARFPGDKVFPNAVWAWKVEDDPAITLKKTDKNWTQTVYITLSHEIVDQIRAGNFPFVKKALDDAQLLEDWRDGYDFRDLTQYISTNGDWMSIYKVKDKFSIILDNSWNFYKKTFIHSYGQVIDPSNNTTTSEGQSYAMLRAVWENDQSEFSGVWAWTHDHFEYRTEDKLFSWQDIKKGNTYVEGDSASASDADETIALALLFAYDKWHNPAYLEAAKSIISDIWRQEVVNINNKYYLTSGSGAERGDGYLLNPSYLAPAYYRIFATVDPQHPWGQLADDNYDLLNRLAGGNNQLPSNWIFVEKGSGDITSAGQYVSDQYQNDYGYDASRVFWQVALDAKWNNNKQAIAYLKKYQPIFEKQVKKGNISAIYTIDGSPVVSYNSLSTTAGALADLSVADPSLAQQLYNKEYYQQNNVQSGYWNDKTNYYDQNWAWFATAFFSNNVPQLWNHK